MRQEGNGNFSSDESGGGRRHEGALSTEEAQMEKRETDVDHGAVGQGGQVTDGLSPRDRQKSL